MDPIDNELEIKRKYLSRYKNNYFCIKRLEEKVLDLEFKINSCGGCNFDCMPRGSVPYTKADMILDKCDYERRIKRLKVRGEKLKQETYIIIDNIDTPKLVEVLELIYIKGYKPDIASRVMKYEERYFKKLHRQALQLITINK